MTEIPDEFTDLFEEATFGVFVTTMPGGTPHPTPVWTDYERTDDGDRVLVNTARNRQKEQNVQRNPNVGYCVMDFEDPYRYVSVRGVVEEVTTEGAVEQIDELARQYMGVEEYPHHGEEKGERVIIRIEPLRVVTSG